MLCRLGLQSCLLALKKSIQLSFCFSLHVISCSSEMLSASTFPPAVNYALTFSSTFLT